MRNFPKYLFFQSLLLLVSCSLPKPTDPGQYINCTNSKFNKTFATRCDLSNVDSVLIESYQKGSQCKQLITKKNYPIKEKEKILLRSWRHGPSIYGWSVILLDSLDADYDYRFVFQDNGTIKAYLLTEITIEPLAFFKKSGEVYYKCDLGSFKINGHTYQGGGFIFYELPIFPNFN